MRSKGPCLVCLVVLLGGLAVLLSGASDLLFAQGGAGAVNVVAPDPNQEQRNPPPVAIMARSNHQQIRLMPPVRRAPSLCQGQTSVLWRSLRATECLFRQR
jgi:hypothetical protein